MNSRLERLQHALSTAIAGMSKEDMSWHPPQKWCATEVLEHLYLTYTGTIKGFERVLEGGKSLASAPTLSQRIKAFLVVGFGYFPEGRKSPARALPRGLPPETVQAEIIPRIKEMDEIIRQCEGKLGSRTKVLDHPILGALTAPQWRKFHFVHGMLHVKQIQWLRARTAQGS